jgi:hypothetical protein
VRAALVALLLGGLAFAACGDDDADEATPILHSLTLTAAPTATLSQAAATSPAETPTATEAPGPAGFDAFRAFGGQIAAAVEARDVDFFLRDPVITTLECPNEVFECSTPIAGINVGLWQSEARPEPVDAFRQLLADEFAEGVRLYALATLTHEFGGAIGGPVDAAVFEKTARPGTGFVIFFQPSGDDWRLSLLMYTGFPEDFTNDWFSGECLGNCYDYYEPWEE